MRMTLPADDCAVDGDNVVCFRAYVCCSFQSAGIRMRPSPHRLRRRETARASAASARAHGYNVKAISLKNTLLVHSELRAFK